MARAMKTSSQSHLRNAARICATEGCGRAVAKDGARGLCSRCYPKAVRAEKKMAKSARLPGVHDDKEITLPQRRNFEWLGDLQSSVRAMQAEE
jgi:hypothetical protein